MTRLNNPLTLNLKLVVDRKPLEILFFESEFRIIIARDLFEVTVLRVVLYVECGDSAAVTDPFLNPPNGVAERINSTATF